jgi:hypothetical protein
MYRLIVSFAVVSLSACAAAPSSQSETTQAARYCNVENLGPKPDCGPCETAALDRLDCAWTCVHSDSSCAPFEFCNEETYVCQCKHGYADCDGNPVNGCETHVLGDPNNCGECGTLCPPSAYSEFGTCSSGKCQ